MTVFKYYFKIVKSFLPIIIMYTGICLGVSLIATSSSEETVSFTASTPRIAIINRDTESDLVSGIEMYVDDHADIVSLDDNDEDIQDALFFRDASLIMIIPKGYTDSYNQGKLINIDILKTDATNSIYAEMLIERYLKIIDVYSKTGMSEEDALKNIEIDLQNEVEVIVQESSTNGMVSAGFLFNFLNYSILAICLTIIGFIMGTFRKGMIKRRNLVSPISTSKINFQLFLGNTCLVIILWVLYMGASLIMFTDAMLSINGLLFAINSFLFSLTALSIAFLIGSFVSNREAINGMSNIIGLGTSFICGAFVPQYLLGEGVVSFSKIFPSYWYIANNDAITSLTKFDWNSLQPVITNYIIIAGYCIGFFIITNVISKILNKKGL